MKSIFIVLFLLLSIHVYCADALIDSFSMGLKLTSYIGTEYHPDRDNLRGVTISRNKYLLFAKGLIRSHEIETELENYTEGFSEAIKIKKMSFSKQLGFVKVAYLYDKVGYGNKSYIFSNDLLSPYYDVYLTDSHQINGGLLSYKNHDLSLTAKLGGNPYNTKIADIAATKKWDSGDVTVFYQHIGYDNYFNTDTNMLGFELTQQLKYCSLYQFACYKRLKDNKFIEKEDIFVNLSELKIPVTSNYSIAINSLYKNYSLLDKHTFVHSCSIDAIYNRVNINSGLLLTSYNKSYIQQYYFMPGYKISELFLLKGYFRFNDTVVGDNYYDFGSQIVINFTY